MDIVINRSAAT